MYPSCWRISAIRTLIVELGMPTVSWYAELALRRRVSMSAMGAVIDMACGPSSPWCPAGPAVWSVGRGERPGVGLPAGLRDARQLTPVRHRAEADPAQAESAVHGTRAP